MFRGLVSKSTWTNLGPRARLSIAVGGAGVLLTVLTFAACGACGKRFPPGSDPSGAGAQLDGDAAVGTTAAREPDASSLRDPLLWEHAREGDPEDLAALAAHEGAMGLVEAASDPGLRKTSVRAMGYARGWAQLPYLAKLATGKDEGDATAALEATVELATRPRRAEDPEDADELREGCASLLRLARDDKRARSQRVPAIRALRMLPCPPDAEGGGGGELPRDVDTK